MRKPKIENKYNLKPKDIENATILDYKRLTQRPFHRNNIIKAWCLFDGTDKGCYGNYIDTYWIGFYDSDASEHAGKIRLICTSHEDIGSYEFTEFFNYREIEDEFDLQLQEKLLSRINWLIDEKIIKINNITPYPHKIYGVYCEGSECSKKDTCKLHCNTIENCLYEYIDYSKYGSGSCDSSGKMIVEHWCGDQGDFKRYKPISNEENKKNISVIDKQKLIDWLLSQKFINVDKTSENMTEEFILFRQRELIINNFVNEIINHLDEFN